MIITAAYKLIHKFKGHRLVLYKLIFLRNFHFVIWFRPGHTLSAGFRNKYVSLQIIIRKGKQSNRQTDKQTKGQKDIRTNRQWYCVAYIKTEQKAREKGLEKCKKNTQINYWTDRHMGNIRINTVDVLKNRQITDRRMNR